MKKRLTKEKLRARNRAFRLTYIVFFLLLTAAALVGYSVINDKLADYEEGLPTTRMAKTVEYAKTGDLTVFRQALDNSDRYGDAYGAFQYFMSEAANGGLAYTSVPTSDANEMAIFKLSAKGVTFAEITLLPIEKPDAVRDWGVSGIKMESGAVDEYIMSAAHDAAFDVVEKLSLGDYSDMYEFFPNTGYAEDTTENFEAFMRSLIKAGETINWTETVSEDERNYSLAHDGVPYFEFTLAERMEDGFASFTLVNARAADDVIKQYKSTFADISARNKLAIFDGKGALDYTELYALCVSFGYPDGGESEFSDLMTESTGGNFLSLGAYAAESASARRYGVSAGSVTLAEFELTDTESAAGNREWAITDVEVKAWEPFSAYIEAPYTATVYVNGSPLDTSNAEIVDISSSVNSRVAQKAPDNAKMRRYHIETVFKAPTIEIFDSSARQLQTVTSGDLIRAESLTDDEKLLPQVESRLLEICSAFSYYSFGDMTLNTVTKYVQSKSPAYEFLRNSDTKWVKEHSKRNNTLTNFEARDFYSYSNTLFSCVVMYDYTLSYKYAGVINYPTAYRFYLEYIGDKWMLYDFELLSAENE